MKVQKWEGKQWLAWIAALLIIIGAMGCSGTSQTGGQQQAAANEHANSEKAASAVEETKSMDTKATAKNEEEKKKIEKKASQEKKDGKKADSGDKAEKKKAEKNQAATISDGTWIVGKDIKPGIYKAENVLYWARLKSLSGELDAIIANGNPQGQAYVEIKKSDKAFKTQGGTWTKIDPKKYKGKQATSFGSGMYLVGKDIQAGTYKIQVTGPAGYWARLKNISGELNGIIANGNPTGPGYVKIEDSDFAFQCFGVKLTKKK